MGPKGAILGPWARRCGTEVKVGGRNGEKLGFLEFDEFGVICRLKMGLFRGKLVGFLQNWERFPNGKRVDFSEKRGHFNGKCVFLPPDGSLNGLKWRGPPKVEGLCPPVASQDLGEDATS